MKSALSQPVSELSKAKQVVAHFLMQEFDQSHLHPVEFGDTVTAFAQLDDALVI